MCMALNIGGGFSLPKPIPFISLSVLYGLGFVAMGYKDHEVDYKVEGKIAYTESLKMRMELNLFEICTLLHDVTPVVATVSEL